jgi:hypothetical protein
MPHKSFTSFKAEAEKEPITFDFNGEHYTIAEPSFILKLHISKLFSNKSTDTKLMMNDLYDVVKLLLGDENFARFEKSGADEDQTIQVISYILNPYADEDTSPNVPKRATKTRSR